MNKSITKREITIDEWNEFEFVTKCLILAILAIAVASLFITGCGGGGGGSSEGSSYTDPAATPTSEPTTEPTATPTTTPEPDPTETPDPDPSPTTDSSISYKIVDTGVTHFFSDQGEISEPSRGDAFYGQDAHYNGNQPSYKDNGDGTVTDLNTGLMWQKTPDFTKMSWYEAKEYAENLELAGYEDWRMPTIKELYSLIDFNGNCNTLTPYINTDYFDFEWGDEEGGDRLIDAQYFSSNIYVGTTMNGMKTVFGVNFADGRIKGYGFETPDGEQTFLRYIRCVRGGNNYGVNNFVDNGDGTITDNATGLMWMKTDSDKAMNWEEALSYAENLEASGYSDWRLPNAKELQSIVDYTRAPDAEDPDKQGPAIDPIFETTDSEAWFWTSTTHLEGPGGPPGTTAAYIAFGMATGYMTDPQTGEMELMNVHGAGAQRSDPKSGEPSDYPVGESPQGDVIRVYNYARCVRN